MDLVTGRPLRQAWWDSLPAPARDRLLERAGQIIEWWAEEDASARGRSYAVVLGERGLALAEPRINTEHKPVYKISCLVLDPSSFRHVTVDHRPPPAASPLSPAGASAPPEIGLDDEAKGVLGNLPQKVQELLQAPFLAGQKILTRSFHYEGHDHHLDMFGIVLAGPRDVTAAVGSKKVPVGHTDATAHWALTCYRASVTQRIGL
ncbi:hypothetical protein [Streptomyces beihaiensis]|uniref:Uncharacterized protein n=1 Tax=Streptomyces beihaiensis TaxID=2984495 RepID=A0ABT3U304_9ACTN|nr:hypothetical protein [Streptomyces beihaiensis]MCX3063420.1 hypothetical protein [Streptomyces beihaiensis]